jgi:hypothetical protein
LLIIAGGQTLNFLTTDKAGGTIRICINKLKKIWLSTADLNISSQKIKF